MTWLMNGEKPISVTAVTQTQQPINHPNVDDDATIILNYDTCNAIIQASWNWPIGRKDMEIYGTKGVAYADNDKNLRLRISTGYADFTEEKFTFDNRPYPYRDPFMFFQALIEQKVQLEPYDLSSLKNNMVVMEVLSAAVKSAKSKKTVVLKP